MNSLSAYEKLGDSNQQTKFIFIFLLGANAFLMPLYLFELDQNVIIFLLIGLIAFSIALMLYTDYVIVKVLLTIFLILSVYYLAININRSPAPPTRLSLTSKVQSSLQVSNKTTVAPSEEPVYKYSFFFVETNFLRRELTTKEMCAIESAAKNNPKALVQLHSITAKLNEKANFLLEKYPNLRVIDLDAKLAFKDTPLMSWWLNGSVVGSQYTFAHMADAFRISALLKYGGVYSDLDTITLKSFEPLIDSGKSGFGYLPEGFDSIGNGVLVFNANNSFLRFVAEQFVQNYKPEEWSTNGPVLFWNSALYYCEIDNIHVELMSGFKQEYAEQIQNVSRRTTVIPVYMNATHRCANLTIFPQEYFYPILYINNDFIFMFKKRIENYSPLSKNAYSLHTYGKLSSDYHAKADNTTFYAFMASKYCDNTFKYVKDNGLEFY